MARIKANETSKVIQEVAYPKFKTLEEQKAFQWGLAVAFNAIADCCNGTAKELLKMGEKIMKDMGWNGKMGGER